MPLQRRYKREEFTAFGQTVALRRLVADAIPLAVAESIPVVELGDLKVHGISRVLHETHDRHPIQAIRHDYGKRFAYLIGSEVMAILIASVHFDSEVYFDSGEVTVHVKSVDIIGAGETFDDALIDAIDELHAYAVDYFAEPQRYLHDPERRKHVPWLLRFLATPAEERRFLLTEPPSAEVVRA